jgi:ABC-type transport system involved in Fe-S cluster assembly fused permease/ATPase subunit
LRFGLLLAGVVFTVMFLYVYVSVALTQQRVQYRKAMNEADKVSRGIHTDSLMSVESVKLFGAEAWESNRYRNAMRAYQKEELKVLMSLRCVAACIMNALTSMDSFLNLCQNMVLSMGLLLGSLIIAFQVVSGQRDVSEFITWISYMAQLAGPLNILGTLYRALNQNVTDTESLFKLLQEPKDVQDAPDAQVLQVQQGAIEFKNVTFSYDGRINALQNVSFKIPPGKSAAFVGPSGSGKSTLFRLLFRFYDVTEGSITVDGVDIRKSTQKSLRGSIGVVPQDCVLMNEDIAYSAAILQLLRRLIG